MRVAIVGATGMLGHHVAREAHRAGHDVIALYRSPTLLKSLEDVDCELRQSDLEDVNSLHWSFRGANAVIHCAARYPRAPKSLAEEMKTTTRLTENLGEVQKRNAVRWSFK
jgi:dihydroflavonol-4-reductase